MKKTQLLTLSFASLLTCGAIANVQNVTPVMPIPGYKKAGSVNSDRIINAIKSAMEANPCNFYSTGNELAEFQTLMGNYFNFVSFSDEQTEQIIALIEQIGATITETKADMRECYAQVILLSNSFFQSFGIEAKAETETPADFKYKILLPIAGTTTPTYLKCLAPLPLSLTYLADHLGDDNPDIPVTPDPVVDLPAGYDDVKLFGAPISIESNTSFGSGVWENLALTLRNHGTGLLSLNTKFKSANGYAIYKVSGINPDYPVRVGFEGQGDTPKMVVLDCDFKPIENSMIMSNFYVFLGDYDTGRGGWGVDWHGEYKNTWTTEEAEQAFSSLTVQPCISNVWAYDNILLDGQTKDIYISVDSDVDAEFIVKNNVNAVDLFGKECTVEIESSNYAKKKIGTYEIVLKATDEYGQIAHATLRAHNIDMVLPVVTQKAPARLEYGTVLTKEYLLSLFDISDNVAVAQTDFVLPAGVEFGQELAFGNKPVKLIVTDSSGNKTEKDFTLEVFDKTAPVIRRKEGETGGIVVIGYSDLFAYNSSMLVSLYEAVDEVDGNCEMYIKSGKLQKKIGAQTLVLGAKDRSGNEATEEVNVLIQADIPPVWILSDRLVMTSPSHPLDLVDMTALVQNHFLKSVSVSNLSIDAKNYLDNRETPGTYTVNYSYNDAENAFITDSFDLKVSSELDKIETKKSGWDKFVESIKNFFIELGQRIKNFFTGKGWKTDDQLNGSSPVVPSSSVVPLSSEAPASSLSASSSGLSSGSADQKD